MDEELRRAKNREYQATYLERRKAGIPVIKPVEKPPKPTKWVRFQKMEDDAKFCSILSKLSRIFKKLDALERRVSVLDGQPMGKKTKGQVADSVGGWGQRKKPKVVELDDA